MPESIAKPAEVSLFGPSGKLVKSQVLPIGQPLEVKGLAAGMYWVKTVVDGQVCTVRFVKN